MQCRILLAAGALCVGDANALAQSAPPEPAGEAQTDPAIDELLDELRRMRERLESLEEQTAGDKQRIEALERILEERDHNPVTLPPYLFSHPEVEDRMQAITDTAAGLNPAGVVPESLENSFHEAQGRLEKLVDAGRSSLPPAAARADPSLNQDLLQEAEGLAERGALDAALEVLEQAERREPLDPRVPFRQAELLTQLGRHEQAIAAYRRTTELDPARASVFYRLGLAHKAAGQREHAVYALEQAVLRSGPESKLGRRADWEVGKLNFGVVAESGFADGDGGRDADTPAGAPRTRFRASDRRIGWWGRLTPHFLPYADEIVVRWRDPAGRIIQEETARSTGRVFVTSVLERRHAEPSSSGEWTVEVLLRDDPVGRSRVLVDS